MQTATRPARERGSGAVRSLDSLVWDDGGSDAGGEPLADDTSPSKQAELRELREQLLAHLPDGEREICRLALSERWPPERIAQRLGITVSDVGEKTAAGLLRLQRLLKGPTKVRNVRPME